MSSEPQRDMIFDLGLHKGFDAAFYLAKGFRVIGLEADPKLCQTTSEKLSEFGNKFVPINKALASNAGEYITFYTVPDKDDWGSLVKATAEKGTYDSIEISIETTDLSEMLSEFGVPYYIKCDLEGADALFAQQLAQIESKPTFVSIEVSDAKDIDSLKAAGYDRAQIVNQWMHGFTQVPNPALEGTYQEAQFNGETSGLFGLELPAEKWRPIDEARQLYLDWYSLRMRDDKLAPGWIDIHVCQSAALKQASS